MFLLFSLPLLEGRLWVGLFVPRGEWKNIVM